MADFSTESLLKVSVDQSSLTAARDEIESELGDITVDVDASPSSQLANSGGGGADRRSKENAMSRQLLDSQTEHLRDVTEYGDANLELNETRNDLLRELENTIEKGNFSDSRGLRPRSNDDGGGGGLGGGGAAVGVGLGLLATQLLTDSNGDESGEGSGEGDGGVPLPPPVEWPGPGPFSGLAPNPSQDPSPNQPPGLPPGLQPNGRPTSPGTGLPDPNAPGMGFPTPKVKEIIGGAAGLSGAALLKEILQGGGKPSGGATGGSGLGFPAPSILLEDLITDAVGNPKVETETASMKGPGGFNVAGPAASGSVSTSRLRDPSPTNRTNTDSQSRTNQARERKQQQTEVSVNQEFQLDGASKREVDRKMREAKKEAIREIEKKLGTRGGGGQARMRQ